MKAIPIHEAQGQLGRLLEAACAGELIVLTDGDRQVALEPCGRLNLDEDSPGLEAELLRAANQPFTPYHPQAMRTACEAALKCRPV